MENKIYECDLYKSDSIDFLCSDFFESYDSEDKDFLIYAESLFRIFLGCDFVNFKLKIEKFKNDGYGFTDFVSLHSADKVEKLLGKRKGLLNKDVVLLIEGSLADSLSSFFNNSQANIKKLNLMVKKVSASPDKEKALKSVVLKDFSKIKAESVTETIKSSYESFFESSPDLDCLTVSVFNELIPDFAAYYITEKLKTLGKVESCATETNRVQSFDKLVDLVYSFAVQNGRNRSCSLSLIRVFVACGVDPNDVFKCFDLEGSNGTETLTFSRSSAAKLLNELKSVVIAEFSDLKKTDRALVWDCMIGMLTIIFDGFYDRLDVMRKYLPRIENAARNKVKKDKWGDLDRSDELQLWEEFSIKKLVIPKFTDCLYFAIADISANNIDKYSFLKSRMASSSFNMLHLKIGLYLKDIFSEQSNQTEEKKSSKSVGIEFEGLIGDMLTSSFKDMHIEKTPASGDNGADLIVMHYGKKIVIQAKCYKSPVGNSAVQEVNAAKIFYDADFSVVVTNAEYTRSARITATKLGVYLCHEEDLIETIELLCSGQ